jgi:hypothetical protein
LIQRKVETRPLAYAARMLSSAPTPVGPTPVCPMCGEPMALSYEVVRGRRTEIEVWRCGASRTHTGAACYALVPPAAAPAGRPDPYGERCAGVVPIWQELREADAAVEHCRRNAERHRAEAERRERSGHDASRARGLLRTFQWLQGEHAAHRDRLISELLQDARTSV